MYDFERGAKVTGSKFYFATDEDAWREWTLITQMIEYHRSNGYKFIVPPYLINQKTATQAGIYPKFKDDYYQTVEGLILIPTAETPLVGYHANEMLKEEDLPLKYVAVSPCFRKEAGGYGSKDKGLKRVHQFHKVELFVVCKPEESYQLHDEMIAQISKLIENFGLEYRKLELPEWDRAPWSKKTIDIELKAGEDWLEVSSISNTEDNQTKTIEGGHGPIRYKNKAGKNIKCHLLNGSGVALPRLVLALDAKNDSRQVKAE